MIRRYGDVPRAEQRYRVRAGAYGILMRGQEILLAWQGEPYNDLLLPGGGIDLGEGAIQALHREVYEETGWRIGNPKRLGAFRRFTFMPEYEKWAEKVCHVYTARPIVRLGPPLEPDHTAIWMNAAEAIPLLCNEGDADFLSSRILR
ncbi:8-oxo-dGTP diphosphatase [Cognatiyoonia koreensis]|uniref:8-oxo-dGTP diphosphatase n=1 Tax=Cognatiyoonia koreensis TaxID=364200 RepID=A0A1I0RNK5_9RHOB|nr:NUDIX hydrolase [Cognatiyoonia koreensis]SEW42914.1 8-oxo-dGTP diphosphatase [Cognatiyoonia koreensis]